MDRGRRREIETGREVGTGREVWIGGGYCRRLLAA